MLLLYICMCICISIIHSNSHTEYYNILCIQYNIINIENGEYNL